MSINLAPGQGLKKVILAVEFRHLYIGITYLIRGMGITAGTFSQVVLFGKGSRFSWSLRQQTPRIEYFYDVNLLNYCF